MQGLRSTAAKRLLPKDLREKLAFCHEHPHRVMFLDIETTGLSHFYDEITVVGWALGGKSGTFIKGQCPDAMTAIAPTLNVHSGPIHP